MTLSELAPGISVLVKQVNLNEQERELAIRLEAMGILPNKPVTVLRKAAFGGPLHIRVGSTTELAIRRREAKMILIHLEDKETL